MRGPPPGQRRRQRRRRSRRCGVRLVAGHRVLTDRPGPCWMTGMEPETAEDFYARVLAATGPDQRLPVAVEEMPGWDIFPFEIDSLRIKPLQPLADEEPARAGEDPGGVLLRRASDPASAERPVWSNERWELTLDTLHEAPDRRQPRAPRALRPPHRARPSRRRDGAADRGASPRRSSRCRASAGSSSPSTATAALTSTCSCSAARPGCSSSAARPCSTGRRTSRRSRSRCTGPTPSTSPEHLRRHRSAAPGPGWL